MHFARPVSGFARNDGGHTALLCLRDIRLRPEQSLADILFVDDIVAVKNTPGLVATNRHIDAFRHTGAYHIPYRCPAQVIKELPRYTCFLTRAHAKYLSYDIDQGEKTDGKSPRKYNTHQSGLTAT